MRAMRLSSPKRLLCLLALACPWAAAPQQAPLAGTAPLALEGDLAARMVEGIDRFLSRELAASVATRPRRYTRDLSSPAAYTE